MNPQAASPDLAGPQRLESPSGLAVTLNANGSVRRIDFRDIVVSLFPGTEAEGGIANLYLRVHGAQAAVAALLGPGSPAAFVRDGDVLRASGRAGGLRYTLTLALARTAAAWFWRVSLHNDGATPVTASLVHAQDLALAPWGAVRLNEHYVSHYLDHAPLAHATRGWMVASRQNLAAAGRHPWSLVGSLRQGASFATDALSLHGLCGRTGAVPEALAAALPGARLQHEHSLVTIEDAPFTLAAGAHLQAGFFGCLEADHPAASGETDLALADHALALPEAAGTLPESREETVRPSATLFAPVRLLEARDLDAAELDRHFGAARRHEEREDGKLLSFFTGRDSHVALRAKELAVLRPHGHLLRTGDALVPDETALTSTAWMGGVFHSMVTQGHVSLNRFLSTTRGYLGLLRAHGQRVFVDTGSGWQLLGTPSAWENAVDECRWVYAHAGGTIEVRATATAGQGVPHALGLSLQVLEGAPARFLVCHHVALDGDDGCAGGSPACHADARGFRVSPPAGSALAQRFPRGAFRIAPLPGTTFEHVGGDECLHLDGRARGEPFVTVIIAATLSARLRLTGELVGDGPDIPAQSAPVLPPGVKSPPRLVAPEASPLAADVSRLAQILPWYAHDALVHYLSPRGLEQFSGGGWGTRDVSQGPVELLLALDRPEPIRDLLRRTFAAQNPDGDWPQWFTFFERERHIRAGDSHGDIVFWPLLALAQYLAATGDASLLEERVPYFATDAASAEVAPVREHVVRAFAVIEARTIPGTRLAAYGHGDWNDSLQPADPALRERLCSAWTVTLHVQVLKAMALALRRLGREGEAAAHEAAAARVAADFDRLLVVGGVVAGYALFEAPGRVDYLLHPRDARTGLRFSLLPMIHAILADVFTPARAREHLALIRSHLLGPDGARLFDRPLDYRGGPMRYFQRAESSAYFGREIGLMYTHAHLRYAQALARVGDAEGFFDALCRANPIGLRARVPTATLRQSNCYYSSSDALFRDRQEATTGYGRVRQGRVALEGGWRVYSSGPGIALGLVVREFLGVRREKGLVAIDPVIPPALDGLQAELELAGHRLAVTYRVGPAGHGPTQVRLNGRVLPFVRGDNPYRAGAAEVPMAAFEAALREGDNQLVVTLG